MVDTEMTATPTQQPEALKLVDVLHEVAFLFGFPYALAQSAAELRFQHDEIARLTAENEALKAAVSEAVAEEREACEERVEDLYEKIETPYLVDITRAIHARDKA